MSLILSFQEMSNGHIDEMTTMLESQPIPQGTAYVVNMFCPLQKKKT